MLLHGAILAWSVLLLQKRRQNTLITLLALDAPHGVAYTVHLGVFLWFPIVTENSAKNLMEI